MSTQAAAFDIHEKVTSSRQFGDNDDPRKTIALLLNVQLVSLIALNSADTTGAKK
jgi:hypothetical protein